MLRRLAIAIGIGAVAAAVVRVRGHGSITPQSGGWEELDDSLLAQFGSRDSTTGLAHETRSS